MSLNEAIHHAVEAAMVTALTYVGAQFKKNRHVGKERDVAVTEVKTELGQLTKEVTRLTREVDQDRTATTLLREAVHSLEREFLRYLRGNGK